MDEQKLTAAQKALRLDDIYVRSVSAELGEDVIPFVHFAETTQMRAQMRHGAQKHTLITQVDTNSQEHRYVEFLVEFGARFFDSSVTDDEVKEQQVPAEKIIASVTARFALLYAITSDVDEDCLREFGKHNAPFHAWPYWRELLNSASSRLKMPAPLLPMYRRSAD